MKEDPPELGTKETAKLREAEAEILTRPETQAAIVSAMMAQDAFGLAVVNKEGLFIRVNRRFAEMVGRSPWEVERRLTYQRITHPDDLEDDREQANAVFRGEMTGYTIFKRYFHKLGHSVPIELTVQRVSSPAGDFLFFLAVVVPQEMVMVKDLPSHGAIADQAVSWFWRRRKAIAAWTTGVAAPVVGGVVWWITAAYQTYADIKAVQKANEARLIEMRKEQEATESELRRLRMDLRKPPDDRQPGPAPLP